MTNHTYCDYDYFIVLRFKSKIFITLMETDTNQIAHSSCTTLPIDTTVGAGQVQSNQSAFQKGD